tara:strand:+ start:36 stop:1355 length:1320 start_codon:yes stop_codon:yes gene_type:complete
MEYSLRPTNSWRSYYNSGSIYSEEGALCAPSRNRSIIKNKLNDNLSSTVFKKLKEKSTCEQFLHTQGTGSLLTDAFNHWYQKDKDYEINPEKYWWHSLLQKVDNHLLQFATNDNAGYSYLAASSIVNILNKLYKKYGDDLVDKIKEYNDAIKNGKEVPCKDFEKDLNSGANTAKNRIRKDLETANKASKEAGKGNDPQNIEMMDLLTDPRLTKLVNVKENNIRNFLKTTIDSATEAMSGKADIKEESLFDSDDIEDLINVENFAHIALFDDLTTRFKKYHVSFDIYIDDSGSMDSGLELDGVRTSYRNLARMLAFKLKDLNILRDAYLFSHKDTITKIEHEHLFSAHIGGGTDIGQCIRKAKDANRPSIIVTDGWDRIDTEKEYHKDSFFLILDCSRADITFRRFSQGKQILFFDSRGFSKSKIVDHDDYKEIVRADYN